MSNVVNFPKPATPDDLLDHVRGMFNAIVVIGLTDESIVALSTMETDAEALMAIERAKYMLLWGDE